MYITKANTIHKGNGRIQSPETRVKIGLAFKGKKISEEHKKKISLANTGKRRTLEVRRKISLGGIGKHKGEKSHWWKGGITAINHQIRQSLEYKLWRQSVFKRDRFTCVWCRYRSKGKINGKSDIHADHIKRFADYPELRFAIDNGRTLCISCHRTTYGRKLKTK